MKIGIIAHLKHPIKIPFAGGLEAFTYEITKRLETRGHKVTLFASSSSVTDGKLHPILDDASYETTTGQRQKKPNLSSEYIAEHHAYYRLMTEIDQLDVDIIFNNSLHYVPITMAGVINTPMVTVLHTPPFYELQLAIKAEQQFKNITYVTVSKINADSWKSYVSDCAVIHNGIDLSTWNFYPAGRQQNYAVWFGRIHPDKGLDHAISAAKLAGIPLKIAGGIGDKRYYTEKIMPLLDNHVEVLGLLDHQQLNQLIGEAKISLITPVWQEPFGLVIAESLACGTPVAGVRAGALPEILPPECGVLAEPGDAQGLADAIQTAIKLDRKEIRAYAERALGVEQMLNAYESLLGDVLEHHNSLINDD